MITNCHRNIMGTISFDGKFDGMNKAQDFIVYPMQDIGTIIHIQSKNRMGKLDLDTGRGLLSAPKSGHAGFIWLNICQIRGTAKEIQLSEDERQSLRTAIKNTGGLLVGSSIVKSENIGAMAL